MTPWMKVSGKMLFFPDGTAEEPFYTFMVDIRPMINTTTETPIRQMIETTTEVTITEPPPE